MPLKPVTFSKSKDKVMEKYYFSGSDYFTVLLYYSLPIRANINLHGIWHSFIKRYLKTHLIYTFLGKTIIKFSAPVFLRCFMYVRCTQQPYQLYFGKNQQSEEP